MATEQIASGALDPISAFALVGVLGVGSQWLAWRLKMPAIVLMLAAGLIVGPILGVFDPARDIGPLMGPMVSIAVAIILFEGGLTLNRHSLLDAAEGVRRLVFIGAPLGWLSSALALHYAAGLSWASSAVFGGIMIVTGPTVIAPLLRSARLSRRPAALLQWEAILNDPIGALSAVLAFEVVIVITTAAQVENAILHFVVGIVAAFAMGALAGYGLAKAFVSGKVPEYMKVPVLFTTLLATFAITDHLLHESGLLAVTVMGIVMANMHLPSYEELRRFKEHATILLVSGVFILLAASMDFAALGQLTWRAAAFVAAVILLARPLTVLLSLIGTDLTRNERLLVAFTGPRGVVLVAVAGLFGQRLAEAGIEDGALIGPLAFVLVAVTVVLHGFTLSPMARRLGLVGAEKPGILLVGGSPWTVGLAELFQKAELPVAITDPNHGHLRAARAAGIETFTGDVLSEAAEHRLDFVRFSAAITATDNDAYNTLVATDLAHEMGRDNVYQVTREKSDRARHQLPASLGGRRFGDENTYAELNRLLFQGWTFRLTGLTEEFTFDDWREQRPHARLLGYIGADGAIRLVSKDSEVKRSAGVRVISMLSPDADPTAAERLAERKRVQGEEPTNEG
ncbi:MAG: sodium:proton exchanger [Proteobacteria bacterium]|nr:MAG: sodium:proton exchanger [Pseudomonadota bacterium]